jgi:hypothetical protein
MQQQTWRTAVLLMWLAAPMALSAQTPSKGGSQMSGQIMIMGSGPQDSTKSDSTKGADSAKAATPARNQAVIKMGGGKGGQQVIMTNGMNFSFGPAAPAKKDSTKACVADSTRKANAGNCEQKKSDSTAATPSR